MSSLDPVQHEIELMAVFDGAKTLDQATKERIRHRVSMRVTEQVNTRPGSEDLSDYLFQGCGIVIVVFVGLLVALVLAIHGLMGQVAHARFGAVAVAALVWVGGLTCLSLRTRKAFQWLGPAWELIIAALCVLGIRSLPAPHSSFTAWTTVGVRAGLIGVIVLVSGFILGQIVSPLLRYMVARRHSSHHPEAAIVAGLLQLLALLQRLETLLQQRDQLILETLARQKRRDDALQKLTESETEDSDTKTSKVRKLPVHPYMTDAYTFEVQQGDKSWRIAGRESTVISRQDDGAFREVYTFEVQPKEGEWNVVMNEQRVLPAPDLFTEGQQWRGTRQELYRLVDELARHIERGLPAKLSAGEQTIDTWLRHELQGRAESVRGWARSVALPSKSSYEDLCAQVGAAIELAAEERWTALPKSESVPTQGFRQRLSRFAQNVVVGVVPLLAILIAPVVGFPIPLSVRDPLLTFAVPWTLLQILEFLVPNASDYLSRSKDLREFLSLGKVSGSK
jgi:hypothetical protein